jgi:hypothetical protein
MPSLLQLGGNRKETTTSNNFSALICFIRCYKTCVNLVATLWFLEAYPLLRNALLVSRFLAMDYSFAILYATQTTFRLERVTLRSLMSLPAVVPVSLRHMGHPESHEAFGAKNTIPAFGSRLSEQSDYRELHLRGFLRFLELVLYNMPQPLPFKVFPVHNRQSSRHSMTYKASSNKQVRKCTHDLIILACPLILLNSLWNAKTYG